MPEPVLVRPRARGLLVAVVALAVLVAGCTTRPATTDAATSAPTPAPTLSPTSSPTGAASSSRSPATADPVPTPTRAATDSPTAVTTRSRQPAPPNWVKDRRNTVAFAPLDRPSKITVEGSVRSSQAWSTSKVLVVAAFIATTAKGDPRRLSTADRRLVSRALSRSDGAAVSALRGRIPGRPGRAMTAVLRSIGDRTTTAPDRREGQMRWSAREQVRFMTALAAGKVVSRRASDYLLAQMKPIKAHAWGLGTIGARAYKGGWLRANTVTRQMGIVDGYAVVLITDGVGPAVVQTDGDAAHVRQLNRLASQLKARLGAERRAR